MDNNLGDLINQYKALKKTMDEIFYKYLDMGGRIRVTYIDKYIENFINRVKDGKTFDNLKPLVAEIKKETGIKVKFKTREYHVDYKNRIEKFLKFRNKYHNFSYYELGKIIDGGGLTPKEKVDLKNKIG